MFAPQADSPSESRSPLSAGRPRGPADHDLDRTAATSAEFGAGRALDRAAATSAESNVDHHHPGSSRGGGGPLADVLGVLRGLEPAADDVARVDQIRALEEVKSAAAAAQATVTAAFVASQRREQGERGVPSELVGRGVVAQVALARRESPHRAARCVGWAQILTAELPHTLAALRRGEATEWRAMLVARETAWLSAEHRARVDAEMAGRLGQWGDRRTEAEARRWAYRLDPAGFVGRRARAEADRRVSIRPAPDTMTYLGALLPVTAGVAAYASLARAADTARAAGDPRGRGQLMADTLVERVTGRAAADPAGVEVNLVMTDQTLFAGPTAAAPGGGPAPGPGRNPASPRGRAASDPSADGGPAPADEPAWLDGYGPLPAALARRIVRRAGQVFIRRLFTAPGDGGVVGMESRRRLFPAGLRRLLVVRDQVCRTPWCGAPIRHLDHVVPAAAGGPTSIGNAQGLCAACNHAKQAPGWVSRPGPSGSVVTITPTGHRYRSDLPDPPGRAHPSCQADLSAPAGVGSSRRGPPRSRSG
ncbi:MAG TPA: DUF222 domain-containing protein [Nocardioidaceae bacterium]|nr:DUF222 domain-containing protein [Nocardioidaceae bacterium]